MEPYESLCRVWLERWEGLDTFQQEKLNVLLSIDDEEQIRSNMELLLSFGDSGLCHVLKLASGEGEQLVLLEGLSHDLLWKKAILEHVSVEDSGWFGVYESGHFDRLEFFVFEHVSYSDLSDVQKKKVVRESLHSVRVPSGTVPWRGMTRHMVLRDHVMR